MRGFDPNRMETEMKIHLLVLFAVVFGIYAPPASAFPGLRSFGRAIKTAARKINPYKRAPKPPPKPWRRDGGRGDQ